MAAKSYTKEDLKKLMQSRKQEQLLEKRIDSPLARYDEQGNLFCRVCDLRIENVNFWTKHLVSKEHKSCLERLKKGHSQQQQQPTIESKKRKIDDDQDAKDENQSTSKQQRTESERKEEDVRQTSEQTSESRSGQSANGDLPKGFFDNPEEDAKARDEIYKNPLDDEYKKFERSMLEEDKVAENLIEEDLTETQNYRELTEIDERIEHWSRINQLEIKRDEKKQNKRMEVETPSKEPEEDMDDSDEEDLEDELNILSNWRRKKTVNR